MKKPRLFKFKLLMAMLLIGLSIFSTPQVAHAQGIIQGDSLPAGTTLHGDGVFYGTTVTIDGNVDGDVFAAGSTVEVNGKVSGSLVIAGDKVTVNGEVGGTIYAAAVQFDLAPKARLNRNIYFAGLSLNTQSGSQVSRDVYAATMGAQMAGSVGGDVKAIIGPAEFFYLIMQKIDQAGWLNVRPSSETNTGNENIRIPVGAGSAGIASAGLASLKPASVRLAGIYLQQTGGIDWARVGHWLLGRAHQWLVFFIFGLLCLWLMPQLIPSSARFLRARPMPSTGWGLLGLVISFNLAGVVLLLAILILAIGLFLGVITLWQLAWPFIAVSGFTLGLASAIASLFVVYISKAIVAFLAGDLILRRFAPSAARYRPLSLLIGLGIYVFVAAIPILGWVIGLVVTALGIGAAWLFYRDLRAQAAQPEPGSTDETKSIWKRLATNEP